MNDKISSYNEVPYPSFVFPQTSPDRLATLGRLRRIETSDPNDSRYLELGCGDGTNLIAFAYAYPESRFVGIDLAEVHIEKAKLSARKLGLKNIEFIAADICELELSALGKFDMIVAHGLFSWIPDAVRKRVLIMYKELLEPNGVGYISYNAFPGCRVRQMMSDMMLFHCADIDDPAERIEAARTFVGFLADAVPENSVHAQIVAHEQSGVASRSDANVFHDDLSPLNQPFYFHEFVSLISSNELSYIGEANPSTANPDRLRPEVRESVFGTSDDPLVREQYIDFVEMRRFRSSLVCRADAAPSPEYDAGALHSMRLVSTLSADGPMNLSPEAAMRFSAKKGGLDVSHPLTKAFLIELERHGASGINCEDALENTAMLLGSEPAIEDLNILDAYLLMMFRAEFITAHSCEAKFAKTISERPRVSAIARHQIESGSNVVTTLAEENLDIENPIVGAVMRLCDGMHTADEIAVELKQMVDVPEDEMEDFAAALPKMIEDILSEFAARGLLEA